MAKAVVLEVEPRSERGKSEIRKLRAAGRLPAVIYGTGIEPQALTVPHHDFIRLLHAHGMHALVQVKLADGKEYLALVKEVQVDAVRQEALHVDFHRVEEDKPVHTEATVTLVGTPAGVKTGGILEVQTRNVAIQALPLAIPETIEFDVSALEIGTVARVGDLTPPEGVTILTDPDETLCSVVAPRVEEAATAISAEDLALLEGLSDDELEALRELAAAAPPAEAAEGEAPEGEQAPAEGEGGE
jgi:large subunit ribosomal protein L25